MSSNTSVATVNAVNGLVTAVSAGVATITATSEGKTGSVVLTASVAPVTTVSVSLPFGNIHFVGSIQATAVTRDANGVVLTGRTVVWSSSSPTIATVNSQTGLVTTTSTAAGPVNIIATSEGRTGFATLTVGGNVTSVVVSLPGTIAVGQGVQATAATFVGATESTGRQISWSSSNNAIATVSSTGFVTGVAAGSVTITATSGNAQGSRALTVTTFP